MWCEGTIVEWQDERGFGFATCPLTARRVFVHVTEFKRRGQRRPEIGDLIEFYLQHDEKGRARAALISYLANGEPPRDIVGARDIVAFAMFTGAFGGLLAAAIYIGHIPWWMIGPYIVLGPVSGLLYRADKEAAQLGEWRISEKTLLLVDLAGGWIGGLFGQIILRHKTRKLSFLLPFWMIVAGHYVFCLSAVSGLLPLLWSAGA